MRSVLKSGFLWQFFGGFALGAVALVTFHPADFGTRVGRQPGRRKPLKAR